MISGCFHRCPCILCRDNRDNRDSITETRMVELKTLSRLGVCHGEMAGQVPGHAGTVCRRTWHFRGDFLSRPRDVSPCRPVTRRDFEREHRVIPLPDGLR